MLIIKNFFSKFKSSNPEKSGKKREFIAKLSKGLMLPIAMLPIAGLFLGIGATISIQAGNSGNLSLEIFGNFLKSAGDVVFGALPVLFAIAIAIAFTKDSGGAALSAIIGYLVFVGLQQSLIVPVENSNGVLGYNILFYTSGSLGGISDGWGVPASLVGATLGITQLQTSVFGGFLVGFSVAFLYNKFYQIQLPQIIGFFNGIRFIPVVTLLAMFPISLLVLMLWPLVGIGFSAMGGALGSGMLGFNSFIFGYIERSLVPFGLHHAFYSPLWYSEAGGLLVLSDTAIVSGSLVDVNSDGIADSWSSIVEFFSGAKPVDNIGGDQSIWAFTNSNLSGRNVSLLGGGEATINYSDFTTSVYENSKKNLAGGAGALIGETGSKGVNIGQYLQGKYPFMIFGLPAAAIAMVMAAPKENRKFASSVVISAGLTCLLTGITEPIEFTFLFLAPWLFWGFHAFMCALSFGLMNWVGLMIPATAPHIGQTFSGGLLDWIIYGAVQIPGGSNAWWALIIGAAYVPIYFFFFLWAIKRFNIATPGREGNTKLFTKEDFKLKQNNKNLSSDVDPVAIEIIKAYGGLDNIKNVDACITKLRIQVANQSIVDENRLKSELGAMGTIKPSASSVYAIYGAKADYYKQKIMIIQELVANNDVLKKELFDDNDIELINNNTSNSKPIIEEISKNKINVFAPVDCKVVDITKVPDETFSEKMIGDGVGIIPEKSDFSSIISNGKISSVFPTGHAYTFEAEDGTQFMLHIGIDSTNVLDANEVKLDLFDVKVKNGKKLSLKTEIVNVDLNNLKLAKSNISPVIALNETLHGRKLKNIAKGKVKKGDLLFSIE